MSSIGLEVQSDGPSLRRRVGSWLLMLGIAFFGVVLVAIQVEQFIEVRTFDNERSEWLSAEAQRKKSIDDTRLELQMLIKQIADLRTQQVSISAEVQSANSEREVVSSGLMKVRKEIELAREKFDETAAQEAQAKQTVNDAVALEASAKRQVSKLELESANLEVELVQIKAQRDQELSLLTTKKAETAKASIDLDAVRKELNDVDTLIGEHRKKLREQQTLMLKTADDLQKVKTELSAAIRKRDENQAALSAFKEEFESLEKSETDLKLSIARKTAQLDQIPIDEAKVTQLKQQLAQLTPLLNSRVDAAQKKLDTQSKEAEETISTLEIQIAKLFKTRRDLSKSVAQASDDLQAAVKDNDLVLTNRSNALAELAAAVSKLKTVKNEEADTSEKLTKGSDELTQLAIDRSKAAESLANLQSQLLSQKKQLDEKTKELASLVDQLKKTASSQKAIDPATATPEANTPPGNATDTKEVTDTKDE
jgi:chromosome segregation ATPase